jgi:hypothetical protein
MTVQAVDRFFNSLIGGIRKTSGLSSVIKTGFSQ